MNRPLFLFLCAALSTACGRHDGATASPPDERPQVLDGARSDYHEDEGSGRVVADVAATLRLVEGEDAPLYSMSIEPSALGPLIDPIPGFRGVRGANHQTARELGRLFDDERIEVVTRPAAGGGDDELRRGSVTIGRFGRLPERRRVPGGGIDYDALTREALPLTLAIESGAVPAGEWRTDVLVGGRSRLTVEFVAEGDSGRIKAMTVHGAHTNEVEP